MALITPGLHCRYDWVLVGWGGGTGTCANPESFVIGGPTLTPFFVDKGIEYTNTTICVPSSARQRNFI